MNGPHLLPDGCLRHQEAILADPLAPGPEAEAHLRSCPACAEARVAFLAQEEAPLALTPAGYHERLPGRILRKLPARTPWSRRLSPAAWALAATLLLAVGAGAFWAGRAVRTPLVEASLPHTPAEIQEVAPDAPFQEGEDAVTQLSNLTPDEAEAVIRSLAAAPAESK